MTSIAILDPFAGISGDMTLGALLDAGVDSDWLRELPVRMGFDNVTVSIKQVTRCSIKATKVDFEIPANESEPAEAHHHHHHGRTVAEIKELLARAPLADRVLEKALEAFGLLGDAEGRAHGVSPDAVHLHEVGAVDAVLDIVGVIEGFDRLGVDAVFNLPVAVGNGWAKMAHGMMPVPAAATATLLEGVDVRLGAPVEGEATTPTGATILKVLSEGAPPPYWRLRKNSWGAGSRDTAHYPNALRMLLAEMAPEAGQIEIVATDIDDLRPEYVEPMRAALMAKGALDCSIWPTHAKKGRIGLRVEVLVPPEIADDVIATLFEHSTTTGVRRWTALRNTLSRKEFRVELQGTSGVRIKVWDGPCGIRLKPEYDDVMRAAKEIGQPPLEVARLAERSAEDMLYKSNNATKSVERRD